MTINPLEAQPQTSDAIHISEKYPVESKPQESNHQIQAANCATTAELGLRDQAEPPSTQIEVDSPDTEDQSRVAESTNTSVSPADSTNQTQDQSYYDCRIPIPGSKQNKQMYPRAPVFLKCWDQIEYQRRFEFVKSELQGMVDRDIMLRDVAQRISYELRMVGTSPKEAFPSIVIRCRCDSKHVRALQSLFSGRAQEKLLHCEKGFFLLRKTLGGPIPPLKLVYFKERSGPVIRIGSEDSLQAFFDNTLTYCGGLACYQASSATLGVSIHVGDLTAYLTVDHLFAPGLPSASQSTTSLENASPSRSNSMPLSDSGGSDLEVYWENDDDDYDYNSDDDLDERPEENQEPWVSGTTRPISLLRERHHSEQWEKVILPLSLGPAMAYLDWSLARPVSSSLKIPQTNAFFLNGPEAPPVILDQIRDQPRRHLDLVKVVSGVRGVLLGELLQGSSFLASPPGQADCEVLTVILQTRTGLISGECGSIVVDHETNEIYGHVVGCNSSGHALIVPLSHTFSQIKYSFGVTDVGLTLASGDLMPEKGLIAETAVRRGPSDQASTAEIDGGSEEFRSAMDLVRQRKHELAEKLFRDALKIQEQELGLGHRNTLSSMAGLATVLYEQGKYDEAEMRERRVVELREKALGSEDPDTLNSINNLAVILDRQGCYREAENMHQQTLKLRQKVLGHDHPDTLVNMNNLAPVLASQGKHIEAQRLLLQTIQLQEKVLGPEHIDTLTSKGNLAMVYQGQGKYGDAERIIREILAVQEEVLGREHPDTLTSMNNLGVAFGEQGRYLQARDILQEALVLRERLLGLNHPDTVTTRNNTAICVKKSKYDILRQRNRNVLQPKGGKEQVNKRVDYRFL